MRRFNTAGPCRPAYDYMIPPERRMPEALELAGHQAYFALHAPRQTGKTTKKRVDLLVRWPFTEASGKRSVQRAAFELKVWRDRDKKGDPLAQGLKQIDEYLAGLGLDEGVLVIFDARGAAAPIEERTRFEDHRTESGRRITLLRG